MKLLPYQENIKFVRNAPPIDAFMMKKHLLTAYLQELENRMWYHFASKKWDGDEDEKKQEADKIVIDISKEMNIEWNNHRKILDLSDDRMPYNGFIQVVSKLFDFPIKLVPIMK